MTYVPAMSFEPDWLIHGLNQYRRVLTMEESLALVSHHTFPDYILANAFRLFALHTDCLPACNQSPLKRDCSILLEQTETRTLPISKYCPLPTDSVFIC